MALLARQPSLLVRETADQLQNAGNVDYFIRSNWRVVPDPLDAEYIRTPDLQLKLFTCFGHLQGDCDDAATLAGALLYQLGIPAQLIAIRMPHESDFSHVFVRADLFDGSFLDIDPIVEASRLPITDYAELLAEWL